MNKHNIMLELLKLEYLNLNNGYEISDIVYIYGKYIVNLEHIYTKVNVPISFENEYNLIDYLLYEVYEIKITDVLCESPENIEYLNNYKELESLDEEYVRNHILYLVYHKYKKMSVSDEILINSSVDDIEYDENLEIDLKDINKIPKESKYYVNSSDYKLNKANNNYLLDYKLNYNLVFLDGYDLKKGYKLNHINFMIKDVSVFKYGTTYRINLEVLVIEDNHRVFITKIPNFYSFEYVNIKEEIIKILNMNKESFKLQVQNKLKDLKFYKTLNDYNIRPLTYYSYKEKVLESIVFLSDFYIGYENKVITKEDIKALLHTYFIRNDSHKITIDIFREYLLRNTGVKLISYGNFLKITEEVIREQENLIKELKYKTTK